MKAAPFAYVRPATLDDAVAELVRSAGEGKVLAGGQSLVPILAMRLARPSTVVDIGALSELDFVRRDGDELVIGALVRQRTLEGHPLAAAVPLLRLALPWIGHRELRSRGTVCGSIAHADPAAELPAVACCLGASLEIAGPRGRRTVAAAEFFHGAMATSVGSEDVLAAVRLPVARLDEGFGFAEIARRHGDFALAGVATRVRVSNGQPAEAVLTAFGVSDRPVTRDVTGLGDDDVADLARDLVDTAGDTHGSREYRQRLVAALAVRELARARRAAEGGTA
ncbi:FAD binding domain-containing protein [Amycolatopsis sp. NPDC005232]|uniref:FAD binding domain-containing protein n=1 Tax=Amycolatopsis sp. NPDC005232 TaxID=3157027 RepID=UPI0033B31BF7